MIYISIHLNSWYFSSKQFLIILRILRLRLIAYISVGTGGGGAFLIFTRLDIAIRITFICYLLLVKILGKSSPPPHFQFASDATALVYYCLRYIKHVLIFCWLWIKLNIFYWLHAYRCQKDWTQVLKLR